jgi:sortase A
VTATLGPGTPVPDDTEVVSGEVLPAASPDDELSAAAVALSARPEPRPPAPLTSRRIGVAVAVWVAVTLLAVGLVIYGVGPMLQQRDQRGLLREYRTEIRQAANEQLSFVVDEEGSEAPDSGAPVAIVDIGDIHVEQVVVEGVGPQQTLRGPGHVPGTAGPGQPGNSAVVARRSAFGASFSDLGSLDDGDRILVTTSQGRSVYEVSEVRQATLRAEPPESEAASAGFDTATTVDGAEGGDPAAEAEAAKAGYEDAEGVDANALLPEGDLTLDDVYGPSPDDRLTLVTSASRVPWAGERAVVVVALLQGDPFEPTPQNGRNADDDGRSRDGGAAAPLALAFVAYGVAAASAVVLYRRARPRSAYLLTAPPLLAATVLTAESVARMLPAWF